ncbi:MAG TPA: hypothetical protein VK548_07575 [Candidatus Acidoferrum sp.]|nr:hypothetical protein [Candidatus Acidoferrum sp.]
MIIRRCAWHHAYHGYPMTFGVASWRGLGVSFTDGMCRGCAIRFRRQHNLPAMPSEPSLPFLRVVVSGAIAMILILAVRSPDLGRMPATTTPPPETVFVPTLVERQPSPRVPGPAAPRRVRLTPPSRVPQTTVATVTPRAIASEPDLFADEPENEPLMLAALPEPAVADTPEPYKPSARGTQFYARSTFAAVPGAELTTQTR